jgi:SAM-dependent methyltransferase
MSKIILNLGCGKTRLPNSIGVDRVAIEDYVDIVHDLNVIPYPFQNNQADEIHFYHVLEHLHNPVEKLEEIHRILRPGGMLYLRVPHFSSMGAFTDITHLMPFGFSSFDCFDVMDPHHYYTKASFKLIYKQINYFGLYPNTGVYSKYIHTNQCLWFVKPFVIILNKLIKMSPTFFERIWCYWVGGACEIEIAMRKV